MCISVNKEVISRPSSEYIIKPNYEVVFTNEDKGIEKIIVDRDGNITDFPGVDFTDKLIAELGRDHIAPTVVYEVRFEKVEGNRIMMVWTVRPDGRYWMDSWGFGGEDYDWLDLYSFLDENGDFTAPFKLYSIGYNFFGEIKLRSELW